MINRHQLFQAEFHYRPNIPPVELHDSSSRSGELLGSGDGIVGGATLQGRVHWSLFEVQGPICETNMVGVITTDNGSMPSWQCGKERLTWTAVSIHIKCITDSGEKKEDRLYDERPTDP